MLEEMNTENWQTVRVEVLKLLNPVAPLKFFEVFRQPLTVTGVPPVCVGHAEQVKCRLGGPGSVIEKVDEGGARDRGAGIDRLVDQLREVGVDFVGNALAITVKIDAGIRRGSQRVLA
jgi:hypothetical protein